MRHVIAAALLAATIGIAAGGLDLAARPAQSHNIVLFVPDGLRALAVTHESAPALAALRDRGVSFSNPHSLFPTLTTANASSMATGHYLGDTGNFSNTIFTRAVVRSTSDTVTPFLEHDIALGDVDRLFGGNYLNEETIVRAARLAGYRTAIVGKLGPTLIFDHTDRRGAATIVIDDSTGRPEGIPLSPAIRDAISAAGLPVQAPSRGDNGNGGTATVPGTQQANIQQQGYFVDVTTKVILPAFGKTPFVLMFWSRDPDGSQHNQGDSLNRLEPGINGPTSRAGIKNADDDLKQIEDALKSLGLADSTDIIVAADHGFSTISKQSRTSVAASASYPDVPASLLPPGFLAVDIAAALKLPLFDPDDHNARLQPGNHPKRANGVIGRDPKRPQVVVAGNGGSDLVYVSNRDKALTARIVEFLGTQDYVSGIFVDDAIGDLPGTLPLSAVNLRGRARTPHPTLVVSFTSGSTGCEQPLLCGVEVADTTLQQGQGNHGSFSRADTMNFMAAAGPDFSARFVDAAPVSNADVGMTIAALLKLKLPSKGRLVGRVITEALPDGRMPSAEKRSLRATRAGGAVATELEYQVVGSTRYFDVAGTRGRTLGLEK